ncbi:hypothetical protein [Ancylobacter sp. SL191]|uniref:hypothetical protein n=1 Tax=Ancylobacter sp. SL191 TaxID=2995166 RepID=UPI00226FC38D|nr:hypothetical protein [Ancylobacter sp. SL191]WAC26344.1 hypothetical protein OU996_15160 [Ancylobacter sp. SL191]
MSDYWYGYQPKPVPDDQAANLDPAPDVGILDIARAGRDHATYIANTAGEAWLRERAYDERIDAVFEATGVRLENPTRAVVTSGDAIEQLRAAGLPIERSALRNRDAAARLQVDAFNARLRELGDSLPDNERAKRAAIAPERSIEDDMRRIDADTRAASERALRAENVSWPVKWGAYLGGSIAGSFAAPENLLGLVVGGPVGGAARTAAGAILRAGVREAVANAAVETLAQPVIAQWRTELGVPANTPREMLTDIGMAAAFGGVVGGGFEAAGRALKVVVRPDSPPIAKGLAGDDEALIAAVRAGGDAVPPELRAAAEALEADRLVQARIPKGADIEAHELALSAAMRRAEDPDAPLPRDDLGPEALPPRDLDPDGNPFDAALQRLERAQEAFEATPMDNVSARRVAMAEVDRATLALREAVGLTDDAPRDGFGELVNIVTRDLPAAREGRQIMTAPVDDAARLEVRRDALAAQLRPTTRRQAPAEPAAPPASMLDAYPSDAGPVARAALDAPAPRFTELAAAVAACRV